MKIDINRASLEELTQIKHVGPAFAQKIIDNRPYRDIYELSTVLGLGDKRMNQIFEQGLIYAGKAKMTTVETSKGTPKEKPEKSVKPSPAVFLQNLVDHTTIVKKKEAE